MYHGDVVPGFPSTRTAASRRSPSCAAASSITPIRWARPRASARGDVQWLTAGRGIVHAEMFPLLERERDNPLELFQIWLNLPTADKMVEPHFSMLWSDTIPKHVVRDSDGRTTEVAVIAGRSATCARRRRRRSRGRRAPTATWRSGRSSWRRARAGRCPPPPGTNRTLYFFRGSGADVDGHAIPHDHRVELRVRAGRRRWTGGGEETSCCCCRAARSASRSCSTARS